MTIAAGSSDAPRHPSSQRSSQPAVADAASWATANQATETGREQLAYLLDQPDIVTKLNERFGNLQPEQRQGHVFEWMHELSFNLDAIARDDQARLRVTTWLGQPHAPADLRLYSPSGQILDETQAKVIGDATRRIAGEHGISASKYDEMNLLVPSDHVAPTQDLLVRRLGMPEGPLHSRYADVRERLTDRLTHGETNSEPVSTDELRATAEDPGAHLRELLDSNQLSQFLIAGGAATVAATLVASITVTAVSRVRTGGFSAIPWTSVACQAAMSGATAGVTAMGAQGISLAAQHAVAAGATGAVEAFAGGTLPYAVARGAWAVAGAAHGWATGRLGPAAAAAAATEAVARTGAMWACAAIGQAVIPVPIVGALVGGMVGQYGATMMIQGIHLALAARDMSAEWDREYEQLLAETQRLEEWARAEREQLNVIASEYRTAFTDRVLPALDLLQHDFWCADPDTVLQELANLTLTYAGSPLFTTVTEFNAFMVDESLSLVLDLGGGRAMTRSTDRTASR